MSPTICLADMVPSVVQKLDFELAKEEEIISHHFLCERQRPLGDFEIEFDVELFEEWRYGVIVLAFSHLDNLENFFDTVEDAGG